MPADRRHFDPADGVWLNEDPDKADPVIRAVWRERIAATSRGELVYEVLEQTTGRTRSRYINEGEIEWEGWE